MSEVRQTKLILSARRMVILCVAVIGLQSQPAISQDSDDGSSSVRLASLPTENTLEETLPPSSIEGQFATSGDLEPPRSVFSQLKRFRPLVNAEAEWLPSTGGFGISSYGAAIKVPMYPIFGPPPPLIQFRYERTDFQSPSELGLPDDVLDLVVGISWVRRINDRWTVRTMGSVAFASDGDNTSSDAWQFRGGAFAMYSRDPAWIWTVGVIALGRNDLPAVPAVGLIWQPSDSFKLDLILPRPRMNFLLLDGPSRQCWGYLGGGFSGGTWAFERGDGQHDQLTYGDWRLVVGVESVPRVVPGVPFQRGHKIGLEVGYSFARDLEFQSDRPTISLDDTALLQATISF
ncbi:DUF6268 family outer membrane beta-barrel protein [Thalassoroseus pseudoceratinae]|uniref:DUF6268 family outer membrane beta-barrel protein n=1 Tax=Thalassoroseus pseudoceratinae TaxID=2713176 RepID=UPI00141F3D92|nr:DUF6268 family outer membrane beta-barrel protein [Thalassoroseus pseudoceratinae]